MFDERSVTVVPMSSNPEFQPKTFYRDEIEIVIEGKVVQAIKEY
jgi:SOS-response transcriptional repressor LexA